MKGKFNEKKKKSAIHFYCTLMVLFNEDASLKILLVFDIQPRYLWV
jgi:hypothetical protein